MCDKRADQKTAPIVTIIKTIIFLEKQFKINYYHLMKNRAYLYYYQSDREKLSIRDWTIRIEQRTILQNQVLRRFLQLFEHIVFKVN